MIPEPKASPEEYNAIWSKAMTRCYPEVDKFEGECRAKIDNEFYHQLALHTQVVIKESEICYPHGRVLYSAVSRYLEDTGNKNINIIETGTARGFSSLCMARALDDAGRGGDITTFDVLPHRKKMYWNCIDDHTKGKQTREELLDHWKELCKKYIIFVTGDVRNVLEEMLPKRVHLAFLDSGHTYDVVRHEIKKIAPRQESGDIVVFDDYSSMFPEVKKAIASSCQDYNYGPKIITANHQRGYCVATKR